MLQRDQFELLSAYLDGEVTATERRQVEELLSHDEQVKQLYARLLRLRSGFQGLPLEAAQPVASTVEQVMTRLDQRRLPWRGWLIGGGAIAAMTIGAMTGLLGVQPRSGFQFAWQESASEREAIARKPAVGMANSPVDPSTPGVDSALFEGEGEVAADALMIALDQPILDLGGAELDSGGLSPVPSPEAGVN
jgi:hypothetical protein